MPNIDWLSFILGAVFAMFVWPFLAGFLGRIGGGSRSASAA